MKLGGILLASVGCRESGCLGEQLGLDDAPAQDGDEKLSPGFPAYLPQEPLPPLLYRKLQIVLYVRHRAGLRHKLDLIIVSKVEPGLRPRCGRGYGGPGDLKVPPEARIQDGTDPFDDRVGRPVAAPIENFTRLGGGEIGPKLQEGTEVRPSPLGLGTDTHLLYQRHRWVFRYGVLHQSTHYKGSSEK